MSTEFIFAATVDFAVKGCTQHVKTFSAETLAEVKDEISAEVKLFRSVVQTSYDKDGDFRAYCPEFANSYPNADWEADWDGEAGEEVEITLLTVLEEVITTVEVEYNDDRHIELRKSLSCD